MRRTLILLLLCSLAETSKPHMVAHAAPPIILGAGGQSCGTWTAEQGGDARFLYGQWLLGYISAFNRWYAVDLNILQGTDGNGLIAWMNNYCATHPLDAIETAAVHLIGELSRGYTHR